MEKAGTSNGSCGLIEGRTWSIGIVVLSLESSPTVFTQNPYIVAAECCSEPYSNNFSGPCIRV